MKMMSNHRRALLIAAAATLLPSAAIAQDSVAANNVTVENVVDADDVGQPVREEKDDKDFPWGLLGLLGLAGLLGLKKRDDDRDIHVDARRDKRA